MGFEAVSCSVWMTPSSSVKLSTTSRTSDGGVSPLMRIGSFRVELRLGLRRCKSLLEVLPVKSPGDDLGLGLADRRDISCK